MSYHIRVLLAIDQLVTALLGGWPDESLSSYAWRLERRGKLAGKIFRRAIDSTFWWDANHCYNAWLAERERRQLPPEFRV